MPVRAPFVTSRPIASVILCATLVLSITLVLTGCGVSSTATEWSWVSGSNTADASGYNVASARFNWTDSADNAAQGYTAQSYAGNQTREAAAQPNHFWEFTPETTLWSWAGATSPQKEQFVAVMPELTPTDNAWTWVNGSNSQDETYSAQNEKYVPAMPELSPTANDWSWASGVSTPSDTYIAGMSELSPMANDWSWVSGSSTKNDLYLAAMPELSPTENNWQWVTGSGGINGNYGTQGLASVRNIPGARCADWIDAGEQVPFCGDDLQASLKDFYRYGP